MNGEISARFATSTLTALRIFDPEAEMLTGYGEPFADNRTCLAFKTQKPETLSLCFFMAAAVVRTIEPFHAALTLDDVDNAIVKAVDDTFLIYFPEVTVENIFTSLLKERFADTFTM